MILTPDFVGFAPDPDPDAAVRDRLAEDEALLDQIDARSGNEPARPALSPPGLPTPLQSRDPAPSVPCLQVEPRWPSQTS